MKWVLLLGLCALGCSDGAPPVVSGNPGSGVGESGGTAGTGGAAGAGGAAGSGGGEARGACDNESDIDALENAVDTGRDIASDCGLLNNMPPFCASMIGNGESYGECIAECVEEAVDGLSPECSACYGDLERCGLLSFCRPQCQFNTCSPACLGCLNLAGCIEEFEECRGLPGDDCPT